jgi:hypothetical protein
MQSTETIWADEIAQRIISQYQLAAKDMWLESEGGRWNISPSPDAYQAIGNTVAQLTPEEIERLILEDDANATRPKYVRKKKRSDDENEQKLLVLRVTIILFSTIWKCFPTPPS